MSEVLFRAAWASPSNIALVKYWGKYGVQLPSNPSISFTLSECRTESRLELLPKSGEQQIEVYLDGEKKDSFVPKIAKFIQRIAPELDWLNEFNFRLHTRNTFPHSSGIASSASGMSALALICCDLHEQISGERISDFYRKASHLARLGSGSACRSVYGGLVSWGEHAAIEGSSQDFGTPFSGKLHPVFKDFQDCILLVHQGEKSVSSTVGHDLMNGHPFAEKRFELAGQNLASLVRILESGDLDAFIQLVESEALMLHGLMMSSVPYFILMKPNTLKIIEKIWDYRKQNGVPVLFTLDAGANVHLLYPAEFKAKVEKWIDSDLSSLCENKAYICDHVGQGPYRLNND